MSKLIVPAQIRAARALLDISQEDLAKAAEVAISSVRDVEGQKRAPDVQSVTSMRRALENLGVEFLVGSAAEGFGVRMIANRPTLLRRPSVLTMWDGVPLDVEWQGEKVTVFVKREDVEDLGRLSGQEKDEVYLAVVEKNIGEILDGVQKTLLEGAERNRQGHVYLKNKHLPRLA